MVEPKVPKGKKGDFLKKKVAGIPMPVILVVGAVGAYYLYSKYKSNAASTSSTATPTASTGTSPDTSGGYYGGGGGYTGSSNGTSPTDTSASTAAPTSTATSAKLTPIGKKTITVGGKSFNTVSGFIQNGVTYLGINNPAEAKRLEAQGVTLVHNPNDPNSKSLFVLIPKGASGPTIKKPPAARVSGSKGAVPGPPPTASVIRGEQARRPPGLAKRTTGPISPRTGQLLIPSSEGSSTPAQGRNQKKPRFLRGEEAGSAEMAVKPKGKKKSVGVIVGLVVAGVAAYYLYTKYKSSSSTTTPDTTTPDPAYQYGDGSGDGGSGGGGGGGSPTVAPTSVFAYPGTGTTASVAPAYAFTTPAPGTSNLETITNTNTDPGYTVAVHPAGAAGSGLQSVGK